MNNFCQDYILKGGSQNFKFQMLHINYSKISLTEFDNIFYELREHHVIFTFKNDRIVHLLVVLKGSQEQYLIFWIIIITVVMKGKYKNVLRSTFNSSENKSKMYVPIVNEQKVRIEELESLRRTNAQLREKQEIYIDKLIKLEEGLQKQHLQFTKLQDLYNELFISYKQKEEEISQLQQHYRQTDRNNKESERRKIETVSEANLKNLIEEKNQEIQGLRREREERHQRDDEIRELQQRIQRINNENAYYKNKQRMNDSRASLESKVFLELQEWQRQADFEKEGKIKMQYENEFLKNRNEDLEGQIKQLQNLLTQKQSEILKLRQTNIHLHRQSAQNRKSRSRSDSKSPRKKELEMQKTNKIIENLHVENMRLKQEIEEMKRMKGRGNHQIMKIREEGDGNEAVKIRTEQFFSFSGENNDRKRNESPKLHSSNEDLQSLPGELEIQNLIVSNSNKKQ